VRQSRRKALNNNADTFIHHHRFSEQLLHPNAHQLLVVSVTRKEVVSLRGISIYMSIKSSCILLLTVMAIACTKDEQEVNIESLTLSPTTEGHSVSKSNGMQVKYELDTPSGTRNDIQLYFSGGFKNDDFIVKAGRRTLYHGVLTTDNRIAYAGEMQLSRKYQRVDVFVNGVVAQIGVPVGFTYCLANRMQDTLKLHFTNDEPRFR
jgi:hypothetical protein